MRACCGKEEGQNRLTRKPRTGSPHRHTWRAGGQIRLRHVNRLRHDGRWGRWFRGRYGSRHGNGRRPGHGKGRWSSLHGRLVSHALGKPREPLDFHKAQLLILEGLRDVFELLELPEQLVAIGHAQEQNILHGPIIAIIVTIIRLLVSVHQQSINYK